MASSTSSSPSVTRLSAGGAADGARAGAAAGRGHRRAGPADQARRPGGHRLRRQQGPQAGVPAGRRYRPRLRRRRHLRRRRLQSRTGHRGLREAGGPRLLRRAHGPDPDALGGEHAALALPARHPRRAAAGFVETQAEAARLKASPPHRTGQALRGALGRLLAAGLAGLRGRGRRAGGATRCGGRDAAPSACTCPAAPWAASPDC